MFFIFCLVFPADGYSQKLSVSTQPQVLKIAVIDTGVDFEHELLQGLVRIPSINDGIDDTGHGTHIAGIIANFLIKKHLKNRIEIIPIRYYHSSSSNKDLTLSLAEAIDKAIGLQVDIINISAGGPKPSARESRLIEKAYNQNILVVAAAGNKKPEQMHFPFYPAAYNFPNVISVVGTGPRGNVLATSNINSNKTNYFFPGFEISSTLPGNRIGKLTGSSQAAAQATAEIARLLILRGKSYVWTHLKKLPLSLSINQ